MPERQGREHVWWTRKAPGMPRAWHAARTLGDSAPSLLPAMPEDMAAVRLSPNGRLIAFAVDGPQSGPRQWKLFDRRAGRLLDWTAADARRGTGAVWRPDSGALLYIQGGDRDSVVERAVDSPAAVPIATGIDAPDATRLQLLSYDAGAGAFLVAGKDDVRRPYVWRLVNLAAPRLEPVVAIPGAHFTPFHADARRTLLLTDHEAPNGKIIAVSHGPAAKGWRTVAAGTDQGKFEEAAWTGDGVAVRVQRPLYREALWYPAGGGKSVAYRLPHHGTISGIAAGDAGSVLLDYSATAAPRGIWRASHRSRPARPTLTPSLQFDTGAYRTRTDEIVTAQGARIPLLITEPRSLRGPAPVFLYVNSYEGLSPAFAATLAFWLQRTGGVSFPSGSMTAASAVWPGRECRAPAASRRPSTISTPSIGMWFPAG
ncbi:hypothetical protein D3872_12630 [Massilia cavernae]|uniref:Peptidase S9A N-terminal domain-containing protein n=2 Tax=Massilia cavernae TaxID=2320864 RepID=A0A418XST8_9BURK|nr:hypothetical protein D3872_12630 [Massilia cavernae]